MRILILLLLPFIVLPLHARDVYKWITPEGEVVYSENYQPGADTIRVQDKKRSTSLKVDELDKEADAAASGDYLQFDIVQPSNDETIRSDENSVSVGLSISPPLFDGHAIHLYVDGKKLDSEIKTTQLVLQQLSRGTHTIKAEIVDAEGELVKQSGSTTFHLRQAAVN
ncbi:MAG: DUF4124 domain-containing protein [Candidatus Thiodiazotropha sp. (ex Ctena orbiculata)]|nr:DUF4124 domain-containing protein [Candidatus Thiodiazotropha taylori]